MGVPGGLEVSNSVKKNRTWTHRSSFERHEMHVVWRGHSIRNVVTRFREGGSQTRSVVDSNAISIVTGAYKAWSRMV
jgi:hypothetical protein